jgi:hypothetical protein
MPKVPSQKDLESACKSNNGTYKKWSQSGYVLDLKEEMRGGVCKALSGMFLYKNYLKQNMPVEKKTETPKKKEPVNLPEIDEAEALPTKLATESWTKHMKLFGDVGFAEALKDPKLKDKIELYQGWENSSWRTVHSDWVGDSYRILRMCFEKSVEPKLTEVPEGKFMAVCLPDGKNVTDAITDHLRKTKAKDKGEAYHLISIPGHAMAAVQRRKDEKGYFKLFDPNGGQAIFDDFTKFRSCVTTYLGSYYVRILTFAPNHANAEEQKVFTEAMAAYLK